MISQPKASYTGGGKVPATPKPSPPSPHYYYHHHNSTRPTIFGRAPPTPISPASFKGPPQSPYANGTVFQNGRYRLERTIGKGSFGKVKLAYDAVGHRPVAIKFIPRTNIKKPAHWTRIKREMNLTSLLHHPNIVRTVDSFETATDIVLVQEYIAGSDLFDLIIARQRVPPAEARQIFRQLVSALAYLHGHNVVHRDLKPENVMIGSLSSASPATSESVVKLIDFGFATLYDPATQLTTNCGSPLYAAPEIVRGVKYIGPEVDCWSLGIILYCMFTGSLPFEDESLKGLYEKICAGSFPMPPEAEAPVRDLLRGLICVDPRQRLTIQQVGRHPWVQLSSSVFSLMSKGLPIKVPLRESLLERLERDFMIVDARLQVWRPNSPAHRLYVLMLQQDLGEDLSYSSAPHWASLANTNNSQHRDPMEMLDKRLADNASDPWTVVLMPPSLGLPDKGVGRTGSSVLDYHQHLRRISEDRPRSCQGHGDHAEDDEDEVQSDKDISTSSNNQASNNFVMQAAVSVMNRFRRLREYAK